MSTLLGLLNLSDRDTTLETVGQRVIYDAVNELALRQEAAMREALALFVQGDITEHSETYKLAGGGEMQEMDRFGRPGAVKRTAEYSVAYDIRDFRTAVGWDEVTYAYMTVADLDAHIRTVFIQHANTVRKSVMQRVLRSTNETFKDALKGDLTIRRLANNDGTVYPPVVASTSDTTGHTHYLGSGYAPSAISDTNDPLVTIRDHIEEHYGTGNIVVFCSPTNSAKLKALTEFVPASDRFIREGASTAQIVGSPGNVPGKVLGRCDEVWVVEWRWMPANYLLGLDLNQPSPLKRRIDVATSLRGFRLVADWDTSNEFPLAKSTWRDRHGYGVAERLNGVAMFLDAGGSYTVPSAYA
jgi:hypothetical protein